jgi:signal transduction histidine kinase/ActR/RegA family two-component response regulator
VVVGAGTLLVLTLGKLVFAHSLAGPTLFLLHFVAVLAAAWIGGLPAGITITLVSALLGYFISRASGAALADVGVNVLVFCIEAVAISWLAALLGQERWRALAAAREAREATDKLQVVLGGITDGITMQDDTGKLVYANQAAARIVGFPTAQAFLDAPIGEVIRRFELFDASGAPFPLERLPNRALFSGQHPEQALVRFKLAGSDPAGSDELHWSVVDANGVFDPSGRLRFVVNVFRDVTLRQQQEEALRRAEERRDFLARATIELNSSLDYVQTLATVARLAVPRMADWCAVDVVEEQGLKRLAVAHVDPSRVEWVKELERRYRPDPNATSGTANILRTGKAEMISEIPAALLAAAARDAEHLALIQQLELRSYIGVPLTRGGSTFGVITLVMAESRRVYRESDLEGALALADRAALAVENARLFRAAEHARSDAVLANRAKDDFLAMLGHELRNPLAPIVTALEVMRRRPGAAADRERSVIERQMRHVVRLVDDLLDVSRIIRGRVELSLGPVDVGEVVAKALELAAPLIEERRLMVATRLEPGLVTMADATRVTQVLTNLLLNAAKYTDPGGHISVSSEREQQSLVLRVEDDGSGIEPEMLSRIFELFVQAPQTLERARGGLGLGLTIVQSLVSLFGGSVTAHSSGPGQGSQFVVRLPLTRPEQGTSLPVAQPEPEPVLAALRVLVVDDNTDAREMLAEVLQLQGHETHTAPDGEAALGLAERVKPDLALLDIGLPGMDGHELGRRLRALPGLEHIQLVALTGYGQAADRERSRRAGFQAHLVKPVDFNAMGRLMQELFGPREAA